MHEARHYRQKSQIESNVTVGGHHGCADAVHVWLLE